MFLVMILLREGKFQSSQFIRQRSSSAQCTSHHLFFFFSTHEKVHGGNRCGTQYLELLFLRQKTEVDVSENICYNVNPLMLLTGLKASSVVPLPMRSRLSSLRRIANPGQTPTAPRIFSVQFLYCSIFLGICFKRTWDLF